MKKRLLGIVILIGVSVLLFLALFWRQTNNKNASISPPAAGEKPSLTKVLLTTSGEYQITGDKVVFDFALTNHSPEGIELLFGSGQQFELAITDEKGEEVYRYSNGKVFTLAIVERKLNPGEALHWQDQWDRRDKTGKPVRPGRYRAEIEIMVIPEEDGAQIDERQLRTSLEFDLPEQALGDKQQSAGTSGPEEPAAASGINAKEIIPSAEAKAIIANLATAVMEALRAKDAEKLASFVHPAKGVRFTPYTYVNPGQDLVFTPEEIRNFFNDDRRYLWGHYDGSGEEIRLTPGEYYAAFIYTADFLQAEAIGYNQVLSHGNMLENQFEVYENPIIVEYYFSGFDPAYQGMDWQSLRLVFEEDKDEWWLTGIIHNRWTI
ncbi:MAG TPA: BsuPI-related putative proteinase inhibitor [Capillibacterium sp.]